MTDILLCKHPLSTDDLSKSCGIEPDLLHGISCEKTATLSAYTPYLLGTQKSALDQRIVSQLSRRPVAKAITNTSLAIGPDNTLALAELANELRGSGVGIMGATTSVYSNRIGAFGKAIQDYQKALLEYRDAMRSNSKA